MKRLVPCRTAGLVYESYEISRCRNQNVEITTKATKFLGDLEITTKSEILRWTNHTNPETLSPTNSHHETFSKFLAVLGLPKILAILEGSEQIFPRKRSLGAPESYSQIPLSAVLERDTVEKIVGLYVNQWILLNAFGLQHLLRIGISLLTVIRILQPKMNCTLSERVK